jgi:hypothetical protein
MRVPRGRRSVARYPFPVSLSQLPLPELPNRGGFCGLRCQKWYRLQNVAVELAREGVKKTPQFNG